MCSILCLGSFWMGYCIRTKSHGGYQPVAVLRCYGSRGVLDSSLQLIYTVGSGVSYLPLNNSPEMSWSGSGLWYCFGFCIPLSYDFSVWQEVWLVLFFPFQPSTPAAEAHLVLSRSYQPPHKGCILVSLFSAATFCSFKVWFLFLFFYCTCFLPFVFTLSFPRSCGQGWTEAKKSTLAFWAQTGQSCVWGGNPVVLTSPD